MAKPVCPKCKSQAHVDWDDTISEFDEDGTEYWRCCGCSYSWTENHIMDFLF